MEEDPVTVPDPRRSPVEEDIDHHIEIGVLRNAEGKLAFPHVERGRWGGCAVVEGEARRRSCELSSERGPEPQVAQTAHAGHAGLRRECERLLDPHPTTRPRPAKRAPGVARATRVTIF